MKTLILNLALIFCLALNAKEKIIITSTKESSTSKIKDKVTWVFNSPANTISLYTETQNVLYKVINYEVDKEDQFTYYQYALENGAWITVKYLTEGLIFQSILYYRDGDKLYTFKGSESNKSWMLN
jgi:hypothetical protein